MPGVAILLILASCKDNKPDGTAQGGTAARPSKNQPLMKKRTRDSYTMLDVIQLIFPPLPPSDRKEGSYTLRDVIQSIAMTVFRLVVVLAVVYYCAQALKTVSILGASGYTGAELTRILINHPGVKLQVLTGDRSAGMPFRQIFPQFSHIKDLPILTKWEDSQKEIEKCDVAFCCLPHGTTQEIIKILATNAPKMKIIDLSADFRLKDVNSYEKWYGKPHAAPELQKEAVYGLTEINRSAIQKARLIANPGCYPTASQLPLLPLIQRGLVSTEDIIIDAKSGATGAGRAPKESSLYCEVTEGIHPYGVASHRHAPEIEQGYGEAAGKNDVVINFTPHLMPMARGILTSMYVKLTPGTTVDDCRQVLQEVYQHEKFVYVMEKGVFPQTRHVRGSNMCYMNIAQDRVKGRAIVFSAIDNVVKGASGQAVQNMNLVLGFPEETALLNAPLFP